MIARPSRARRAAAALAAAVLVACTLLVSWHKATTLHGVCAEHGDELHLEQVGELRAGDRRHGAGDGAPRLTESTWVLEDGDHHCQLVAVTRGAVVAAAADGVAAAPADPADHALPDAVPPPAGAALLRLAPKTSPPV